jgi:sarcosine oxidase delta subunit
MQRFFFFKSNPKFSCNIAKYFHFHLCQNSIEVRRRIVSEKFSVLYSPVGPNAKSKSEVRFTFSIEFPRVINLNDTKIPELFTVFRFFVSFI